MTKEEIALDLVRSWALQPTAPARFDMIVENYEWVLKKLERVEDLKKQNKFLMERENKLQLIENMFKNEPVDLKELSKLVRGE